MTGRMGSEFKGGVQIDRDRESSLDKMVCISTRQSPLTIHQCTITARQCRNLSQAPWYRGMDCWVHNDWSSWISITYTPASQRAFHNVEDYLQALNGGEAMNENNMTDRPRRQGIHDDIEQAGKVGGFEVDCCRDEENWNGSGGESEGESEKLG